MPHPPGIDLDAQVRDCIRWIATQHRDVDPVVAVGMGHYQFETLHPFNDGNGRIGRLLIVLQLHTNHVLVEPTLTVSPWFEARRSEYDDRMLAVSAAGDWDGWIRFFATGVSTSATATNRQLTDLLAVQSDLKQRVRAARLRAETAMRLVDFALEQPIFTVRQAQHHLGVTYPRANALVGQMVEAAILSQHDDSSYHRRFTAPDVLAVLLR